MWPDCRQIDVDQFYGIELGEFPARIAEVALWMMDHIMNNKLTRIWRNLCSHPAQESRRTSTMPTRWKWTGRRPDRQGMLLCLGNPPFGGAKYQTRQERASAPHGPSRRQRRNARLRYAWFIYRGRLFARIPGAHRIRCHELDHPGRAGRATLAASLRPLRTRNRFAHRTFAWGSDARGKAHVHVVIIGLCQAQENRP